MRMKTTWHVEACGGIGFGGSLGVLGVVGVVGNVRGPLGGFWGELCEGKIGPFFTAILGV